MMGRYLGPVLFLGICVYLLQNQGRAMSIPLIDKIPGVGSSPAEMQFASAVVFGVVGAFSLLSRFVTRVRGPGDSEDE